MRVRDAIRTRISVREFTGEPIDVETQIAIVNAARLSQTGHNSQHWRFILTDTASRLSEIASLTKTGHWLKDAAFVVVVCTDPDRSYHEMDAARAVTTMQLFAWECGIGSCICTGFHESDMRSFLDVPPELSITALNGFGYPRFDVDSLEGRKERKALESIAYRDSFETPLRTHD